MWASGWAHALATQWSHTSPSISCGAAGSWISSEALIAYAWAWGRLTCAPATVRRRESQAKAKKLAKKPDISSDSYTKNREKRKEREKGKEKREKKRKDSLSPTERPAPTTVKKAKA